ncbi:VOC family protein [Breoghania sp.]|uniref:VOC family protein n=1 Tax=Breoghania sp. TaxID=2065378 RepID=UPI002AAB9472|nr:VOC family protein [Breoghania sp.]
MEQRISLITLGVDDLATARAFFEAGLGWHRAAFESEKIAFYQCGSMALALFGRADLAADAGLDLPEGADDADFQAVTIAWNGRSEAEVDSVFEEAVAAGAQPLKSPHRVFWGGYSSYVRIPGSPHLLEIAYNPGVTLDQDGRICLP